MLPTPRLRTLFTSRWFALIRAVLVILTAINFVGTAEDKPADAPNVPAADGLTNDQRAAIANAL
ncbi:hypothetical protein [Sphingobium olei]|uniref:Uncharacterized protein n=1 Tax=Sphingobium olei TaxID=420955 RepID=A0ABW3P190_9SPHN|nr:hypothetical protein [Sphingobium sp.]